MHRTDEVIAISDRYTDDEDYERMFADDCELRCTVGGLL